MFVPYASDVYPEYRPWLAYLTFPVFVFFSFYLAGNDGIPAMHSFRFISIIEFGQFLLFFYMLWSFLVLWTLGKAVCCKIGNILYAVWLCILFVPYAGLSWPGADSYLIWFLSWFVGGIAGLYLVFAPENTIDCFFAVPPFRGFSITGYWFLLILLLFDFLFALVVGWYWACALHPLAFFLGIVYGGLLLKSGRVRPHPDERTLWQMIKQREPEDRFWQTSWSVRKKQEQQEEAAVEESNIRRRHEASKKEFSKGKTSPVSEKEGDLAILCECGQVVYVSREAKEGEVQCPDCGHSIHPPINL